MFGRFYCFSNGGGLEEVLFSLETPYRYSVIPGKEDVGRGVGRELKDLEESWGFELGYLGGGLTGGESEVDCGSIRISS